MGAAREKGQADFDLERFIDMFDEAITSSDERVVSALRNLMMMVILTSPESRDQFAESKRTGPLRQLYDDLNVLNSRMHRMEEEHHVLRRELFKNQTQTQTYNYPYEKYAVTAAKEMASSIDRDLLNQLKASSMGKIQGLK